MTTASRAASAVLLLCCLDGGGALLAEVSCLRAKPPALRAAPHCTERPAPERLPSPFGELPSSAAIARAFDDNPVLEVAGSVLVLASSAAFAVGTLELPSVVELELARFDTFISVMFAIEWFVRWYSTNLAPRYVLTPLALVDLVSWLPVVVELAMAGEDAQYGGGLAFLRLLRVLRLQRFVRSYGAFSAFEQSLGMEASEVKPYQLEVARVVSSIFTLLFVATGLIYTTEHAVNPAIPDFFTALYFGLTTLTTVGFGDIVPITPEGRLVVSCSILAGVAVIPIQLASLGEAIVSSGVLSKAGNSDAREAGPAGGRRDECAACGEASHLARAVYCHRCGAELEARSGPPGVDRSVERLEAAPAVLSEGVVEGAET